ncbi:hypothetical protein C7T94_14105 [Pedobacter yulinensis]|uniref:DUF4397 domain-containing protein n=1 Tax=Pedobacter yulinensis TaxID=2126353 RepID=A0A2T3HMP0_9SPHI|nr:hypothetical protein [Pedobacter yulinensis]PST83663.1 hypothetical protein C7T94_14105 [Pedobacter yulinensis]
MKTITHITRIVTLALLCSAFGACKKEKQDVERAMHIVLNGYNGSAGPWQIAIDTVKYTANNYSYNPGTTGTFNIVFPYRGEKERFLTITDTDTKKVLYSKPLPQSGSKAAFNFIYADGRIVEVNPPAADPALNRLGFYVQYSIDNAPFDISMYRKDATTGQEYRYYLAKNVKPKTWVYVDYLPVEHFSTTNDLRATDICFTKAGTTDQWAFEDTETKSQTSAFGFLMPVNAEKGLVQPYFVVPGPGGLLFSRLFFYPERSL